MPTGGQPMIGRAGDEADGRPAGIARANRRVRMRFCDEEVEEAGEDGDEDDEKSEQQDSSRAIRGPRTQSTTTTSSRFNRSNHQTRQAGAANRWTPPPSGYGEPSHLRMNQLAGSVAAAGQRRMMAPRLSLLGKPIYLSSHKCHYRNTRSMRWKMRLRNFLEQPQGFLPWLYHFSL